MAAHQARPSLGFSGQELDTRKYLHSFCCNSLVIFPRQCSRLSLHLLLAYAPIYSLCADIVSYLKSNLAMKSTLPFFFFFHFTFLYNKNIWDSNPMSAPPMSGVPELQYNFAKALGLMWFAFHFLFIGNRKVNQGYVTIGFWSSDLNNTFFSLNKFSHPILWCIPSQHAGSQVPT